METADTIRTRRSVHQYSDEDVDDETLTELFDRVTHAPSSFNLQPWEFLVVRDDERKRALREVANDQEHVTEAAATVVVLGNLDPAAHAETVFADWAAKEYLPEAQADGLTEMVEGWREWDKDARRLWTTRSTALAAQTLMTAAWDLGLATCPMEGFDRDGLVETFDLDGYEPVMLVSLGYPAEDAADLELPRKLRRDAEEVVHYDEFDPVDSTQATVAPPAADD